MYIESYSYVDGNTYVTWYPLMVNGVEGIFILHLQGNLRKLESWFYDMKKYRKPIFFCDATIKAWKNHKHKVGEFSNGSIIYQLDFKGVGIEDE